LRKNACHTNSEPVFRDRIKVKTLKTSFGANTAVNGVSFNVEMGEVLGFLGPNGAGKSTTMRMLTGFIPPSAGEVFIGGFNMLDNPIPAKRLIGYLPENAPSYTDMTVLGFLRFAAELRGLRGEAKKRAIDRVVEMCFLESVLHQSVETLSKGYRHRTCFAQAIIHDPEVLILDEPTDGLDPNQKHEVRTLIRNMGQTKAIIFSTHILEEVEAACSRAIIIDRGQIVANGTPDQLKQRSEYAGAVTMRLLDGDSAVVTQKLNQLPAVGRCVVIAEAPLSVRAFAKKNGERGELARAMAELAAEERWRIEELHTEEGRLDEVFRSITLPDTKQEEAE
jgi:ABC-2 type transport system ATP-binding protein